MPARYARESCSVDVIKLITLKHSLHRDPRGTSLLSARQREAIQGNNFANILEI